MSVVLTTLNSRHDHDEWLCLDLTSMLETSIAEIERAEQCLILTEYADVVGFEGRLKKNHGHATVIYLAVSPHHCFFYQPSVDVIGPPTSRLASFSFVYLPCSLQLPRSTHAIFSFQEEKSCSLAQPLAIDLIIEPIILCPLY